MPSDAYGHGTHIAGLIAGSGARSGGKYVGVARSARLIGLKVLDAQGGGYASDVIEAVEFATANKAALGIDVINLSLGHPIYEPAATDPLVQAVERAVRAGIVVVVSAGNIGMNPDVRTDWLCRHHLSRELTVRADGRFAAAPEHGDAFRRPHLALQLARADVVRRLRQAGHPCARPGAGGNGRCEVVDVRPARAARGQGRATSS